MATTGSRDERMRRNALKAGSPLGASRSFFERRGESVRDRSSQFADGCGAAHPVYPACSYKLAFRKCLA